MMLKTNKKLNSILVMIVGIFSGLGIGVSCFMLGAFDTDFLWHTVLRDYIVEHKALPVQDIFSWRSLEMGYTEIAHSWLGSVILGSYIRFMAGLGLNYVYCSVSFALLCFIVTAIFVRFLFFKDRVDGFYVIVCAILGGCFSHARIHNMSYLLFILMIYVLFKMYYDHKSKCCYWLPVICLVCANLHGGIIVIFLGVIIIFSLFMLSPGFEFLVFKHNDSRSISKKMLLSSVLSIFAACINPYGIRLFTYFMHLSRDSFNTTYVGEWLPIRASNIFFLFTSFSLMILIITRFRKNNITGIDLLCFGIPFGFLCLSAKYCRFINYAVCSLLPILTMYYDEYMALFSIKLRKVEEDTLDDKKDENEANTKRNLRILYGVTAFVVITLIVNFADWATSHKFELMNAENNSTVNTELSDDYKYTDCVFSDSLVEYLDNAGYERLFCTYDVGGRLIFAGHKSFVDSRADLFANGELSDMNTLIRFTDSADVVDSIIESYNFDGFIMENNAWYAFTEYLSQREDCVLDYCDEQYIVYKRIK